MKCNPIAKNLRVNRPKVVPAKKGRGSYRRKFALAAAVTFAATAAYATQQQNSSRCYERCTTDVTGATHCVSWCQ